MERGPEQTLKDRWFDFVRRQSLKTAANPNANAKLMGTVLVLLLISYHIPKADASLIGCGPCVAWAAQACGYLVSAGGACASVALFPPALCACLLAMGGAACVAIAGTCAVVCLAPTP